MRRFLVGLVVAGSLAGCSTPIPLLGVALDGKIDVQIEAKVIKQSGDVVPVANNQFSYRVYDKAVSAAEADTVEPQTRSSLKTDFDGKSTIHIQPGYVVISGFYSINGGQSQAVWSNAVFQVGSGNHSIRLTNDNAAVTNN